MHASPARDRLRLHEHVSAALKAGRYRTAVAPLSRLVLSLPAGHAALPGLWTTLAFVRCELERWDRAEAAARRALELSRGSELARTLMGQAKHRQQQ